MIKTTNFMLNGTIQTDKEMTEEEFLIQFYAILESHGFTFAGTYFLMDNEGNFVSDLTFADLYAYIQKAERDSVGQHQIEGMPSWSLHIYTGRHQVNVCKDGNSIANFVFCDGFDDKPLQVNLHKVSSSHVADYDNVVQIEATTCIDQTDEWYRENLGSFGVTARDVLMAVLNPVKAAGLKKMQDKMENFFK